MTVLVTSHDKDFMDHICSDIIRFAHQKLHYYPGKHKVFSYLMPVLFGASFVLFYNTGLVIVQEIILTMKRHEVTKI